MYDALRARLAEFGSGRQRCMYCEDGVGTDIDHFFPRSDYPHRTFTWANHLLACADCNRRKNSSFPVDQDGTPVLLEPTVDDPREHLAYAPTVGRFVELTSRGAESITTYKLNRGYLVAGRLDAWVALQRLIVAYAQHMRSGEDAYAEDVREVVGRYSFSSVFVAILDAMDEERTHAWLLPETIVAIEEFPEVRDWLA